jgi:hypothetical protein
MKSASILVLAGLMAIGCAHNENTQPVQRTAVNVPSALSAGGEGQARGGGPPSTAGQITSGYQGVYEVRTRDDEAVSVPLPDPRGRGTGAAAAPR